MSKTWKPGFQVKGVEMKKMMNMAYRRGLWHNRRVIKKEKKGSAFLYFHVSQES